MSPKISRFLPGLLTCEMRFLLLFALGVSLSSSAQNLKSGGALKPEQAVMDIRHYTIALQVDPVEKRIDGYTIISLTLSQASSVMLLDLWHGLRVSDVTVNGRKATFSHGEDDLLRISGSPLFAAGKQEIKVSYGGVAGVAARPPWIGGFQWSQDVSGNPWVSITCQSEGGKIFFPCKDHPSDEPNEGADLIITVPKGLTVAAPGMLQKVTSRGKTSTFHWRTKYTISNYCLVFNIGKYAKVSRTYTTINGNKVPMDFYILEEHKDQAARLLDFLERVCRVEEKYFGEYPWVKEKIGIAETPHLGMEHQTMIAYGNKFKYTQSGGKDLDWLMLHEFGHEWWANKVTNKDWAHMWIQEGICVFGDAMFIREMEGEEGYLRRMQQTARETRNEKPVVQGEVVDSDATYHGDIYGKGAFFMHTLRYVIGDSIFFPTLKRLATDPQYTYDNTVTTADVEQLFSKSSGQNLKPLFDLFLYTIDKLEVHAKQTGADQYKLWVSNYPASLPVEITADGTTTTMKLSKDPITITSKSGYPVIDGRVFYLKRVIQE